MKINFFVFLLVMGTFIPKVSAMLYYRVNHQPEFSYKITENGYVCLRIRKEHRLTPGPKLHAFAITASELKDLRRGVPCKGETDTGDLIAIRPPREKKANRAFKEAALEALADYIE